MKLCPQCAFIYEDTQTFCDMDGKELVPDSPPVVEPAAAPARLTIDIPSPSSSRRLRILAIAIVVSVGLLAGFFLAQLGWRSSAASPLREVPPIPLPATSDLDTTPSQIADKQLQDENSLENVAADNAETAESASSRSALTPASRLRSISSGAGSNPTPVVLRLTNGATIKADEVWVRKDGVWYRQGGLITFLKHSQVRSVERPGAAPSRTNDQRNQPQPVLAQNQPPTVRPQVTTVKKDSRVTSFLKNTGRALKKPFRF